MCAYNYKQNCQLCIRFYKKYLNSYLFKTEALYLSALLLLYLYNC